MMVSPRPLVATDIVIFWTDLHIYTFALIQPGVIYVTDSSYFWHILGSESSISEPKLLSPLIAIC